MYTISFSRQDEVPKEQVKLATVKFSVDAAGLLQQIPELGQAPSPSLLADILLFSTRSVIVFFILSVYTSL